MYSNFFQDMPLDVIRKILLFFDLGDLLAMQRVCKRLRSAVKDESLWRRLCLNEFGFSPQTDVINKFITAYLFSHLTRCYQFNNKKLRHAPTAMILLNPESIEQSMQFLLLNLEKYMADETDRETCAFAHYASGMLAMHKKQRKRAVELFDKAAQLGSADAASQWCEKYDNNFREALFIRDVDDAKYQRYLEYAARAGKPLAVFRKARDIHARRTLDSQIYLPMQQLADQGNIYACEFVVRELGNDQWPLMLMRDETTGASVTDKQLKQAKMEQYAMLASQNGYHDVLLELAQNANKDAKESALYTPLPHDFLDSLDDNAENDEIDGQNRSVSERAAPEENGYAKKAREYFQIALNNGCAAAVNPLIEAGRDNAELCDLDMITRLKHCIELLQQGAKPKCPYDYSSLECAANLVVLYDTSFEGADLPQSIDVVNFLKQEFTQEKLTGQFNSLQKIFKYYDLAYSVGLYYLESQRNPQKAEVWFDKALRNSKSRLHRLNLTAAVYNRYSNALIGDCRPDREKRDFLSQHEIKWLIRGVALGLDHLFEYNVTAYGLVSLFLEKHKNDGFESDYQLFDRHEVTLNNLRELEKVCMAALEKPYVADDYLETLFMPDSSHLTMVREQHSEIVTCRSRTL